MLPFLLSWITGTPVEEGRPRFWQGLLVQVFILAVYAMSYDLLMGYTGILSFGHAMFFGTGAYVVGILMKHFAWSLPQALLAAVIIAVLQGLVIGVLSLRVRGVYFAMVTLAFAEVFFILSEATDFRQYTGAEDGLQGIPVPAWISPTDHRLRFYYLALGFALLMYVVARRVVNSPTGRVMIAIRENEDRALMLGYNTFVYKLIAVVLAGVFAALAGVLSALWNFGASPSLLSVDRTIDALLMTIIGGVGTLVGPMLGAGVLELLGYWFNNVFGPRWPLVFGVVYILIVLFLPYGIVGTWRLRSFTWRQGWRDLLGRFGIRNEFL
jgi:branched-chain amino acid transport system permease protein